MALDIPEVMAGWEYGCTTLEKLDESEIFALRSDAQRLFSESHLDNQPNYLAGRPDGSFATPSRARRAYASKTLDAIHQSPNLLEQVREVVGSTHVAPSRAAYTYYTPGSYLGIHRDVRACTVTLLIALTANLGPLYFAPSKRDLDNKLLKKWVDKTGPYPEPEASVQLPLDRFVAIDGRSLPHWRGTHDRPQTGAIASLCYFDTRFGDGA